MEGYKSSELADYEQRPVFLNCPGNHQLLSRASYIMHLRLLSPSDEAWQAIWENLPRHLRDIYWHPKYCDVSAKRENARAECLFIEWGERLYVYPYLLHSICGFSHGEGYSDIQTPYGYGGPLFVGRWTEDEANAVLLETRRHLESRGSIVAEFIRCHTQLTLVDRLRRAGYKAFPVRNNIECLLHSHFTDSWKPSALRNLRKAQRTGLCYQVETTADAFIAFHRLYELTFQRRDMANAYRFESEYFLGLSKLPSESVLVILVHVPSVADPIAGAILLLGGKVAHYHLGGSNFDFQSFRPNDYLYWAMASEALTRGCERIVWGGGTSVREDDTLFQFKSHFGDVQVPVFCAGRILDQGTFDLLSKEWSEKIAHAHSGSTFFLRYRSA